MATLHVVLGRRIGLPVSLACVGSHVMCRFDDGKKTYNIEATDTGNGGFGAPTDEEILAKNKLPRLAQLCGSDLRAVTPREMLAIFLGFRARHYENIDRFPESERDYLLARYLFPHNRLMSYAQHQISVQLAYELFEAGERGHPIEMAEFLSDVVRRAPWKRRRNPYLTTKKLRLRRQVTTRPILRQQTRRLD